MEDTNFPSALHFAIYHGEKIRRKGWTAPFLFVYRVDKALMLRDSLLGECGYAPSQADMLANDWEEWKEPPPSKSLRFSFESALMLLKFGHPVRRASWKDSILKLTKGLETFTLWREGLRFNAWVPNTADILAEDWEKLRRKAWLFFGYVSCDGASCSIYGSLKNASAVWRPTSEDMFADDWEVFQPEPAFVDLAGLTGILRFHNGFFEWRDPSGVCCVTMRDLAETLRYARAKV